MEHLLPKALVIEILLKLGASDLLRCKSVCKSWLSLINTPSFIDAHLEVSKKINNDPYFLVNSWDRSSGCVSSISIVSNQTLGVLETHQLTSDPMHIVGSYNGIVCLFNFRRNNDLLLWNPATRHGKYVTNCYQIDQKFNCLGFGFDAKNNDYKIVSIQIFHAKLPPYPLEAMVYSLKTGSWKKVSNEKLVINEVTGGVCCGGFHSWMAIREVQEIRVREEVIISFDMTNEVLISTPLPSIINNCDKLH